MLIHNKEDIEFVTKFPCLLGHPVYFLLVLFSIILDDIRSKQILSYYYMLQFMLIYGKKIEGRLLTYNKRLISSISQKPEVFDYFNTMKTTFYS